MALRQTLSEEILVDVQPGEETLREGELQEDCLGAACCRCSDSWENSSVKDPGLLVGWKAGVAQDPQRRAQSYERGQAW